MKPNTTCKTARTQLNTDTLASHNVARLLKQTAMNNFPRIVSKNRLRHLGKPDAILAFGV